MADELSQLLYNDDFEAYRALEIEEGVKFIKELFVKDGINPGYTGGAIAMLRRIVRIPKNMAKNKEQEERANDMINRAFVQLETKLMRKFMED